MKTVYNHSNRDLHVFTGDTPRKVPAGIGRAFADDIANAIVAQAAKDDLPLDFNAGPASAGGAQVSSPIVAAAARLGVERINAIADLMEQGGPLMPISLLNEKNLYALERGTLLQIAGCANVGELDKDVNKQALVMAILNAVAEALKPISDAGSTSGRSTGLAPVNPGSTPGPATISSESAAAPAAVKAE
jgi:hypothetical protein